MRPAILGLMILLGFAASRAEAQPSTTCNGRVAIDTVYSTGVGDGRFEYYFTLRNMTAQRMMADVSFSGFPSNVMFFNRTLPNLPLGPSAMLSPNTRFGTGTNANVSSQTVRVVYDAAAPAGPAIRVTNCRAG